MYVIMKGFFRRDHYIFMLNCLKEGGEKASKPLWTKISHNGAIDYEHWSQLEDKEKTANRAVPINIFLVAQLLGHAFCDVPVTPALKAECEENESGHPRNRTFPLHEDFYRSLLTLPSNTLRNDLSVKDADKYVPVAPLVSYRITELDRETGKAKLDKDGKLLFHSKTININMWRGKYEDRAKLQPVYDISKKGTRLNERGYEPQCYERQKDEGPWKLQPAACKVSALVDDYWKKAILEADTGNVQRQAPARGQAVAQGALAISDQKSKQSCRHCTPSKEQVNY